MKLFKTSILNGIAVLIKTATLFVLNKILAIYVGPSGYAVIGQFQNFVQMVTTFSGSAINTAVVKYTAEYYDEPEKQKAIWQTATGIVFIFSITFAILIFFLKEPLSIWVFKTNEFSSVFIWFSLFLVFFNLNTLLLAILNGKKIIEKLVTANILGSLIALIVTSFLAMQFGIYGALVAIAIYQSIAFFITAIICAREYWFKREYLIGKLDKKIVNKFGSFALMAIVSAICVPTSQIVIRHYLIGEYSEDYAGYWEAMIRFSGAYLMLVTTTLGVYYLPRLSELKDVEEIKKELVLAYKFIFPLAVLGGLIVFPLKEYIIVILFSEEFLPMRSLFLWQILGDIVKIGSWILAYLMLSKAMTKLFIIIEVAFSVLSVVLSIVLTKLVGFDGVSLAHLVNYIMYFSILLIFISKKMRSL